MVSFQCEGCGDVLTKKKLDPHRNRCGNSSFTCLDCMTQFFGNDYKGHTSCVTEAQKYKGPIYKERKPKMPSATIAPPAAPSPPPPLSQKRKPRHAYVSDVDEAMSPTGLVHDTPADRSPSPSAVPVTTGDAPINVFDFLVEDDNSRPTTASTRRSGQETPVSLMDTAPPAPSPPPADTVRPRARFEDTGYVYGDAPIETSLKRFDSDYDVLLREPRQTRSSRNRHSMYDMQTPGNGALIETMDGPSDKKRKRPNVDDLDLGLVRDAEARRGADRGILHSGLTGGLSKLLGRSNSRVEDSPLSPQKRSRYLEREKRERNGNGMKRIEEDNDTRRRKHDRGSSDDSMNTHKKPKAIEGRKDLKAIEYYGTSHALTKYNSRGSTNTSRGSTYASNSEFFLGLIDKDHRSNRGQSIWGALKMFHEATQGDLSDREYKSSGTREQEEKRLLKGLRLKINRSGEIVLFARPASEQDDG